MNTTLRVVHLEDNSKDAELIASMIEAEGITVDVTLVETKEDFIKALKRGGFDIILSDYTIPSYDGISALKKAKEISPDTPFVFVSGTIGEERAVEALRMGATDYVLKNNMERLIPVIQRALREAEESSLRKQAEKALKESEEKYRSIFENAIEGIFQTTHEGRFISINPAMATMHGFASPKEMMESIVNINKQLFVNSEDREQYLKILKEQGMVKDFETQIYRKDGGTMWTSTYSHVVKDINGNILYFEGMAQDITPRKLAEEKLRQALEKLQKSLVGTIQAMATVVETRDPYTAGHQRKVASLARTIAQEMGLPNEMIEGLGMAAVIHDIGKISVPAELLSKPTRLTKIEYEIIKVHPQAGYNILRDIDFPWPIAQIVLQHHERLDGSGYPQGLKDEQILVEAKIMAVADVIEAMASHRPYRPALGIDVALEEIEKNKNILYNDQVVNVCVELLKEKGFKLE